MGMPIDLTGQRFGRLVADVRSDNDKRGEARWECVCDCGKRVVVLSSHLRNGRIRSCGCYMREATADRMRVTRTKGNTKHGCSKTRLFRIWSNMKTRCLNPNNKAFKWYGAVGVTVCPEWMKFENFQQWAMQSGYQSNLTIERISPFGNYEPSNCTWIPKSEQRRNQRRSKQWQG